MVRLFDLFRPLGSYARDERSPDARIREIVGNHADGCWLFMRRLGVGEADLDDAMQEVATIVATRLHEIRPGREKSFMYGTAFRIASEFRRKRARLRETVEDELAQMEDPALDPEALEDEQRARRILDGLLEEMPLDLRAVFVLFELDGCAQGEIAALLGIPKGTVASRLKRARAEFNARLARLNAKRGGI